MAEIIEKETPKEIISTIGEHAEEFCKIVDKAKRVAIFTHSFPDPDAIGSMMAVSWLLTKVFSIESVCFYEGEISHPQNNTLVNLLDPPLKAIEDYNPDNFDLHILVDTEPSHAGVENYNIKFDIVIDHHKTTPDKDFQGWYLNLKAGSACGTIFPILKNICNSKKIWFEHDNDIDKKVATAMITGIITDTEFMTADDTTEYETNAFSELLEFRSPLWLREIVFFPRPKFWVDTKAKAIENAVIDNEGHAVVGLGLIPETQRDLIADMADEMSKWQSVITAIAFAVVKGDRIEGSVRSTSSSLSVTDLCKKLGGRHGSGGGKRGKGAYRYSCGGLEIDPDEDEEIKDESWELINKKESRRIARIVKK